MKALLRKALIALPGVALMAGFGFADMGNFTTGSDSDNEVKIEAENHNDVNVDNDAHVRNDVDAMLSTGNNEAEDNTGDGRIDTGDATADVTLNNRANNTTVNVTGMNMGAFDMDLSNDTTGSHSKNEVKAEFENTNNVRVNNNADVTNDVDVTACTGHNEASDNTGDGRITTGDASATVNVSNTVNTTDVTVK